MQLNQTGLLGAVCKNGQVIYNLGQTSEKHSSDLLLLLSPPVLHNLMGSTLYSNRGTETGY